MRLTSQFSRFGDAFDGAVFRAFVRHLEQLFARVVVDDTLPQTTVTADYTPTAGDSLLLVDTSSADVTVTMPLVAEWMQRDKLVIETKKISPAGVLTIVPSGADLIDTHTSILIYEPGTSLQMRAVSTGWAII